MFFILNGRKYEGKTAVKIVREMENDRAEYKRRGEALRDFLVWMLENLADRIPPRELDVSPNLDDETIAFNFLCLLDQLQLGFFEEKDEFSFEFEAECNGGQ